MSPTWVAFFLGALVWVPMGVFLMALCVAAARGDIESETLNRELRAFEKGRKAGRDWLWCEMEGDLRRKVVQDVIANDTASTGADRMKP